LCLSGVGIFGNNLPQKVGRATMLKETKR